ncbi:serine/threonine protein kinase 2 [Striga asiatica]|uniref:Serine/threonine protein kinase 2 n=1 Tax=Striga asiatica TaxID=4170 RepID=A0A5A7RHW0_STRAF|nr:serine/threonine protein kinase 2 [Striga asiatica]
MTVASCSSSAATRTKSPASAAHESGPPISIAVLGFWICHRRRNHIVIKPSLGFASSKRQLKNNRKLSYGGQFGFHWDESSQPVLGFTTTHKQVGIIATETIFITNSKMGNIFFMSARDQIDKVNCNSGEESFEAQMEGIEASADPCLDMSACNTTEVTDYPPPPSEWYAGYSNQTTCAADSDTMTVSKENNDIDNLNVQENGVTEEGEKKAWVSDLQPVDLWDRGLVRWTIKRWESRGGSTDWQIKQEF